MNSELPVMLMGFADVDVVSETLADSGVDVVDGSLVTVDGLNSTRTRTPFVKTVLGRKSANFPLHHSNTLFPSTAIKRYQNSLMCLSSKYRIILDNCVRLHPTL